MFHGLANRENSSSRLVSGRGFYTPLGSATGVARCLPRDSPSESVSYGPRLIDQILGKAGQPRFLVLRAQPLPATRLAFPAPLGNVNVNYRLPEAITVQGTFHFGSNFLLGWKTKERRFILRKADAVGREDGPGLQRFLGLFNALQ